MKRTLTLLPILLCALLCCGWQRHPSAPFPRTIIGADGRTLTLARPPQRIVSLAPSNTELLYALGLGSKIVLDTTSCDYPPDARNKPHIDALKPDIEGILAQTPDLVVVVNGLNNKLQPALLRAHIPTLALSAKTLPETYAAITLLGRATGQDAQAAGLVKRMRDRLGKIQRQVAHAPRVKVLVMYSDKPIYTTGKNSYISDVIAAAGGVNVVSEDLPGEVIASESVLVRAPDVIVCGPGLVPKAKALPGWSGVPAVRNNRFFTSGEGTLVRPGPRLADAAQALAHFLHPDLVKP